MNLTRVFRSAYKIQGSVSGKFEPVRRMFEKNFIDKLEAHAQLCVYVEDEKVVDLWGSRDDSRGESINYGPDSLTNIFSSTKSLTAICFASLVDKKLLKYSDKVVDHWPEYGDGDPEKEGVTIEQVLRHQGGMPQFSKSLLLADIQRENIKKNSIGRVIEKEPLKYPPAKSNTRTEYHAMTRGFILNELFRRVDPSGRTIGECLQDDIAVPLNTDTYIGLPFELLHRSVKLSGFSAARVFGQCLLPKVFGRKLEPSLYDMIQFSLALMKVLGEAPPMEHMTDKTATGLIPRFDLSSMKTGEIPSANGQCSARGLAKIAAAMANKGEYDGVRILSEETWELFHSNCVKEEIYLYGDMGNFSMGGVHLYGPAENPIVLKHGELREGFFGWQGFGGSVFQWYPKYRIGFSYVPSLLAWEDAANGKSAYLQRKVVECIEGIA